MTERSSSSDYAAGFRAALGLIIGVAAIAGSTYWFNRPAAPPQPSQTSALLDALEREAARAPREVAAVAVTEDDIVPPPVEKKPEPEKEPVRKPESLEDVISQVMPAVVRVETSTGRGSGFYVKPDTLLTNVHVVGSNSSVTIRRSDGTTLPARVETKAPAYDIAILKVSNIVSNQATIPLGDERGARVGQEVVAIGSALGTLQNTVTRGIVSAVRQTGNATLVQTDAAVNPGNSGGPLLDRSGAAIGITTMGYTDRQGLNFAVGIEHARSLLDGRPTPLVAPSNSSANSELRDLSPALQSDSDRLRADGVTAYEQTMAELARRAQSFDADWERFRSSCYSGPISGSFDHEWFALLSERALPGAVARQCSNYHAEFTQVARQFQDAMLRADEAARQAGVYPGTRRDARRKYRLEFEAWDR
jgi:S1-C subfamily serine protease